MPTLLTADEIRLAWDTDGLGPPVLLVGGALDDRRLWDGVRPLLTGHTTHALDRRGRGGSSDRADSGVTDEIDDVVAVLGAVADPEQPAVLVGHSSGALLVLRTAARVPALVRAVVAYEPPPPPAPGFAATLRGLVEAGERDEAVVRFLVDGPGRPEDEVRAMVGGTRWAALARDGLTVHHDAEIVEAGLPDDEARAVEAPVTLLLGTASPESAAEHVRWLAERLPRAAVRELDGQAHFAARTAPELVAAAVQDA